MKKSLITKEYLLTNYTNGTKTVREMSTELGCNHCTIFRALKRFNMSTRPKKEISKEQLEKLYLEQKYTIAKIAEDFNFSETHVNNLIQKYKIETRKYSYLYSQNDEFFTTPNTQNCYWAGFIAADGCIGNCRNKLFLAINLKSTDECLLKEMVSQTEFTGKITQGKHKGYGKYSENTYYYSALQIRNCQNWIESLNRNWNITEKKSLTLLPPNVADLKQQLSYIVGLIDGDGHIGIIKDCVLKFELCGTESMMKWVSDVLYKFENNTKYDKLTVYKKKNQNIYYINSCWDRAYYILKHLEQVQTPYRLARKWDKIKEYESIQSSL